MGYSSNMMEHFTKPVDRRSRQAMVDFLKNHFRYDTMNSWNASTSYANCIKVHLLPIPTEFNEAAYEMRGVPEWEQTFSNIIDSFDHAHDHEWQIGTHGRNEDFASPFGEQRIHEGKVSA